MKQSISIILLALFLVGCKNYHRIGTVRNNVCKSLENKTVLYAVFVDSEGTHPWTEYDISSTLDSIQVSINWLKKQASKNGKEIEIILEHGVNSSKNNAIPFKEEFKYKTLSGTLFRFIDISKGIALVDQWSDNVSKDVARTLPDDNSKIILTQNKMKDRERLIAKLRNQHQTDNIALIFFINNYFENEISVALHTGSSTKTEYAIVSTKYSTVIAHEFLHLFGAWDFYITRFDRGPITKMRKRKAMKKYPNEIMAFTYRHIDSLEISPLTKYLIGWENKLAKGEGEMFIKKRWKTLEY